MTSIFENDIEQRTSALIQEQETRRQVEEVDRLQRAKRTAILHKRGGFAAAKLQGVINQNLALLSPNQESTQGRNVRARARNLYNNNPIGRRYVTLLHDNVIGPDGFRLQSLVANIKGMTNTKVARKVEQAWEDFSSLGNCEVTGTFSLRDVLTQVLTGIAVDGEILVRTILGRGKYGFQIQLLDADRLYSPGSTYMMLPNGNRLVQGVEVDEFNAPVRYHLYSGYQQEGEAKVITVPASEIIHLFVPLRAGFNRGISAFAPVIEPMEMHEGYRKAELVAARMGACKSLVYETKAESDEPFAGDYEPSPLEAGMAEFLPPGVSAKVLDPTHPSGNYAAFTGSIQKEIAAGLGVSMNTLFGDYENASYSSMRAAFSSERSQFRMFQAFLIERFLDRLFGTFIDLAPLAGVLSLTPIRGSYENYKQHEFKPKGFDYFDPSKEMAAWVNGYENNLVSLTEICAVRGLSITEFLQTKQIEQELMKQYGVDCSPAPKSGQVSSGMTVPAGTEEANADESESELQSPDGDANTKDK